MNEQPAKNAVPGNFWSRRSRKGKTFIVVVGASLALVTISAIASPADKKASGSAGGSQPAAAEQTSAPADAASAPAEKAEVEAPVEEEAPAESVSQENARRSAESYLETSAFSRKGLIEQLSSEYGDSFPRADAVYAVNSLDVDWNEQAARSAKSYLETSSFSRAGLIDQLSSGYGENFTRAQAVYGVNKTGL